MFKILFLELKSLKNYIKMVLFCATQIYKIKFKQNNLGEKKIIYIYLNDWLLSSLPIFNLYLAILLKKRGFKPILLFDRFNLYSSFKSFLVNNFLILLIKLVKYKFKIEYLELDKKNFNKIKINKSIIKDCIKFNLMRYNKDVRPLELESEVYKKKFIQLLNCAKNFVEIVNKKHKKKTIFLNAGGFLNSSHVFTEILRQRKKTFYTYDSCPFGKSYAIWYCRNGIAGKLEDSRASYNEVKNEKYFKRIFYKKIVKEVNNELNLRKISKDKFGFQKISKKKSRLNLKNYIIITINSGWDANSLGSDHIFKDYIDYLFKTINFIQIKFPNIKIIIKDHPHRYTQSWKNDSLNKFLQNLKGKNIIKIDSKYNFYDIIKNAKLLISVASTTINEALILGKPAISAGKDKYFYFGLNVNYSTQKEYFKSISKIINNNKSFKFNRKENLIFYYFNHKIRLLKTIYNPQIYSWTKKDFNKIFYSEHFMFLVNMLEKDENYFTSRIKFLKKKNQL
tara:strand:+ start:144 stop:1667 length:1524 start_codon:yes stop_codon:yes gene_type:complete